MNFSDILNLANSNTQTDRKDGNFYKSKFTAPKKQAKDKKLSANIQRFLQKKEQEEISRAKETERKRNALLANRDTKEKNKIRKMLKVIKSADKSVIEDAKTKNNTAITLQGPEQPDEDDYGYVSHEASAYYSKLMEKYGTSTPEECKTKRDNGQKKSKYSIKETLERTKSQLHAETSQNAGQRRAHRTAERAYVDTVCSKSVSLSNGSSVDTQKIKEKPKVAQKAPPPLAFSELLKIAEKKQHEPVKISVPVVPKQEERLMSSKERLEHEERLKFLESQKKRRLEAEKGIKPVETKSIPKVPNLTPTTSKAAQKKYEIPKTAQTRPLTTQKPIPCKSAEKPKAELSKKPQPQYKPSSSSRPLEKHQRQSNEKTRQKELSTKRRIHDDDDESEYDSMDSFIDDEGTEDVSSFIKEIFGYDKSRYRDEEDDVRDMESSFAQQMREESISKKIGLKEDLEDMKQEEIAKKKKAMMKKRRRL